MNVKKVDYKIFLLIIFLLAVITRFIFLSTDINGLYNDELYFLLDADAQLHHLTLSNIPTYNTLYYAHYAITGYIPAIILFKLGAFSARFPNAFYGSLIVFPIFLLTKQITKNNKIGLISSFLWSISPSAIVISRVGFGVEIFPLFLFLFFLYGLIKFMDRYNLKYLILSIFFIIPIILFSSIAVWALIPLIAISVFGIFYKLFKIYFRDNTNKFLAITSLISFFVSLIILYFSIHDGFAIDKLLHFNILAVVNNGQLLPSKSINYYFYHFFVRLEYALSPFKLFWLTNAFAINSYNYSGPVSVPFMLAFEIPFILLTFILIPIKLKNYKNLLFSYYVSIYLVFSGLLVPIFNITVTASGFEPAEGIFALPFFSILVAIGIYYSLTYIIHLYNYFKQIKVSKLNLIKEKYKILVSVLIVFILIFGGINIATSFNGIYFEQNNYEQNNNNATFYPFYGWSQTTDYLLKNNLEHDNLYYNPSKNGYLNFTNVNSLYYWYYHQHFPLYWLMLFSNGKIKNISLLGFNCLPPISSKTIIITQNSSYYKLLYKNGISYTILDKVYRQDGTIAIEIIKINDIVNGSQKNIIENSLLLGTRNIDKLTYKNSSKFLVKYQIG